jgi:hypothetical protein
MNRTTKREFRLHCEDLEGRQLLSAFYVANAASGLALDTPFTINLGPPSNLNGTKIVQEQLDGSSKQQWNFYQLPNNNYEIIDTSDGLVLDDPGFSTAPGTQIQEYQWHDGLNQQWQVDYLGNGNVKIVNAYSQLVLDDPGSSTAPGTILQQYPFNWGANQQWKQLGVNPSASAFSGFVQNQASHQVLDDPGSSTANGTKIQQYPVNWGTNQEWAFVPLADGHDLIVNQYSGKVLDDPGSSLEPGTQIQQFQINGGLNQEWAVESLGQGTFLIVNASDNGLVLEDPGFSTAPGTIIEQDALNYGLNQEWSFIQPSTQIQVIRASKAAEPQSGPAVVTTTDSSKPTAGLVIGGPFVSVPSGQSRFRTPIRQLEHKVDLSVPLGRSRTVFDNGDAGPSVPRKHGIF